MRNFAWLGSNPSYAPELYRSFCRVDYQMTKHMQDKTKETTMYPTPNSRTKIAFIIPFGWTRSYEFRRYRQFCSYCWLPKMILNFIFNRNIQAALWSKIPCSNHVGRWLLSFHNPNPRTTISYWTVQFNKNFKLEIAFVYLGLK